MHSMFMPVVRVWKVQMGVLHWLVPVPMLVLGAGRDGFVVIMLVVFVVCMLVVVLHGLVPMFMFMPFREV